MGRACGSPFSLGVLLQDAAWLRANLSMEVTCTALMPMCGEEDSFPAETSGVTLRTYLHTFTRALGDSHA